MALVSFYFLGIPTLILGHRLQTMTGTWRPFALVLSISFWSYQFSHTDTHTDTQMHGLHFKTLPAQPPLHRIIPFQHIWVYRILVLVGISVVIEAIIFGHIRAYCVRNAKFIKKISCHTWAYVTMKNLSTPICLDMIFYVRTRNCNILSHQLCPRISQIWYLSTFYYRNMMRCVLCSQPPAKSYFTTLRHTRGCPLLTGVQQPLGGTCTDPSG